MEDLVTLLFYVSKEFSSRRWNFPFKMLILHSFVWYRHVSDFVPSQECSGLDFEHLTEHLSTNKLWLRKSKIFPKNAFLMFSMKMINIFLQIFFFLKISLEWYKLECFCVYIILWSISIIMLFKRNIFKENLYFFIHLNNFSL